MRRSLTAFFQVFCLPAVKVHVGIELLLQLRLRLLLLQTLCASGGFPLPPSGNELAEPTQGLVCVLHCLQRLLVKGEFSGQLRLNLFFFNSFIISVIVCLFASHCPVESLLVAWRRH